MSGDVSRVSIPAGVRRTIQNIKEIAGNHSDEEIYAMLKECAMDPNETAQKLLLQDPFHEVKRKRSKRKENVREPADPRWRPGIQGRGGRGGRGNYSSSSVPNDAAAGRNAPSGKDNGANQVADKGNIPPSSITPDTENKYPISISSSVSGVANGPINIDHPISSQGSHVSSVTGIAPWEESSGVVTTKTGNSRLNPNDVESGFASGLSVPDSDQCSSNKTASSVASASDPVLVPSLDTHNPAELGTIKQVIGIQHPVVEIATREVASQDISGSSLSYISGKGSSDMSNRMHGKILIEPQGPGINELSENSQVASSSSFSGSTGSRPSFTYTSRCQHPSGLQKAPVPSKEWKPKSTHMNPAQVSERTDTSNVPVTAEALPESVPAACSVTSEETTMKLEKKLEELKLSDRHVIIPNHLQVPESERHGLSFGSFDANFELNMVFANGPARDKIDTPLSESSQEIEETTEQPSLSIDSASSTAQEADFPDHPQSPKQVPEPDNYSTKEAGVSSIISAAAEYDQSKNESALAPEGLQPSVVQSVPSYPSLGAVPQVLGSQFALFESSESQAPDTSHLPSFLVQQSYDPSASYYTQFYRPTADADGRISPFLAPGASARYNGNIAVLPAQTGQASQESTNTTMPSTAGSTPATQGAGSMQGSVAIPQQPVPVFRHPAGLHISHYHPNYIPYSQYFSQFYVPPPTLHHFLSSAAFPQQPPTGSMYPTPGAATPANPVKYSLSQYKPGPNTGNSMIVGMPTGYGTYNSAPAGYTPGPAASSGNSTTNEDLGSSQFKENNVYIPGQQSEGSAVWIPAPGQDMSTLQASSFYSIPPQGQHMPFAPTQASHGAFGGIYPPTPTVAASVHPLLHQSQTVAGAVEIVGPPAGVYQQPQRAQINWTNTY